MTGNRRAEPKNCELTFISCSPAAKKCTFATFFPDHEVKKCGIPLPDCKHGLKWIKLPVEEWKRGVKNLNVAVLNPRLAILKGGRGVG